MADGLAHLIKKRGFGILRTTNITVALMPVLHAVLLAHQIFFSCGGRLFEMMV